MADESSAGADIPLADIAWTPCWRIIPSRFPAIALFEDVADPADLEAVFAVEALTNDRLRQEAGALHLVAPEDRVAGPGTTIIMAAFTHPNPAGSRFTDGSFGVFYASRDLDTAIAATAHHRAAFLAATDEPAQERDMRVYAVDLRARLHDVRGIKITRPDLYGTDRYGASQHLAGQLREQGSDGIVYASVRHDGGECAAVFRPRPLAECRQERHLCYVWDGQRIATIYEKRALDRGS